MLPAGEQRGRALTEAEGRSGAAVGARPCRSQGRSEGLPHEVLVDSSGDIPRTRPRWTETPRCGAARQQTGQGAARAPPQGAIPPGKGCPTTARAPPALPPS